MKTKTLILTALAALAAVCTLSGCDPDRSGDTQVMSDKKASAPNAMPGVPASAVKQTGQGK